MKILVIRFSSLGDTVLTTALYPNLKNKWPDCEITILTKAPFAPVFDGNPSVDHVRIYDPGRQTFSELVNELREIPFDIIIDLQGNFRSWWVRFTASAPKTSVVEKAWFARMVLVWFKKKMAVLDRSVRERILDCCKSLDVPIVNEETQLFVDPKLDIYKLFDLDPAKKYIGIAPGAKHAAKQWPVENFAESANRLGAAPGTVILLLGDKSDSAAAQQVANRIHVPFKNLTGWTNLNELTAVLSKLRFLMTNDSGIMHMAEALKIPLVAMFGPTVRGHGFAPYRSTSRVAEVVGLACRPCSLHGGEVCPLVHHRCMKDLDVDAVLFAASSTYGNDENTPPY